MCVGEWDKNGIGKAKGLMEHRLEHSFFHFIEQIFIEYLQYTQEKPQYDRDKAYACLSVVSNKRDKY